MKRLRAMVELLGAGLVTTGAFLFSPIAGCIVAGVCLLLIANFAGDN